MAKEKVLAEKEKMNPFLWFLFAIVIPMIFAVILTAIAFAVAGVDVVNWAKNTGNNIPVLSSVIITNEEAKEMEKKENTQAKLETKDEKIEQLKQEKEGLEGEIDRLQQKISNLEKDLAEAREKPEEDSNKTVKQIASSFTEMKDEQAALILEQLEAGTAFLILSQMSNEERGTIMGNMDPEAAADITKYFIQ